jgi:hypothetical protein
MANKQQTENSGRLARQFTQQEITEIIGAAKASEKLVMRVESLQALLAKAHGDVEAMRWPENLIGQMEKLLEIRDYNNILALIDKWKEWLNQNEAANLSMKTLIDLIVAFVEDYKATNGLDG